MSHTVHNRNSLRRVKDINHYIFTDKFSYDTLKYEVMNLNESYVNRDFREECNFRCAVLFNAILASNETL